MSPHPTAAETIDRPAGLEGESMDLTNARRATASWLLAAILVLGAALRVYRLTAPVTDLRCMRQAFTAGIARDCYRKGLNPAAAKPDPIGFERSNFPLYPWIVSLAAALTGGVHEWQGRLMSVVFSLATVYLAFLTGRLYWGERAGLWAALFLALTPASVFFGRAFMPEAMMMFFMAAAFYGLSVWNVNGSLWGMLAGGLALGIAVLTKLTPGMLVLPAAWLLYSRKRWKTLFGWPGVWLAACVALPIAIWYAGFFMRKAVAGGSTDFRPGWRTVHFYVQMFFNRPAGVLFGPAGYFCLLVGLLAVPTQRRDFAMHAWVAAGVLYFFKASSVNFALEYYNLPIVPVGCLLAGRGMSLLTTPQGTSRLYGSRHWRRWLAGPLGWTLALFCLAAVAAGFWAQCKWEHERHMPATRDLLRLGISIAGASVVVGLAAHWLTRRFLPRPSNGLGPAAIRVAAIGLTLLTTLAYLSLMYESRSDLQAAGLTLRRLSDPGDKIIEAADKQFVIMYYADRRGWFRYRKHFSPEHIDRLVEEGATWFVSTLLDELRRDKRLLGYLDKHHRLASQTQEYVIYQLMRGQRAQPSASVKGADQT